MVRMVAKAAREKETVTRETLKKDQHAFAHSYSMLANTAIVRGAWPMSQVAYTDPQALDVTSNHNHLTNTAASTFGYTGLIPHVTFDGVNQYLTKADGGAGNWSDVLGTEAYVDAADRGLTLGGWFNPVNTGGVQGLMMKGTAGAATSSYELFINPLTNVVFRVSTGAAYISVTLAGLGSGVWSFIVGRYIPSTEIKVWINGDHAENVVAVPAALPDTAVQFSIGAVAAGVLPLGGMASHCFLCAGQLSDAFIGTLYQQGRAMFGV